MRPSNIVVRNTTIDGERGIYATYVEFVYTTRPNDIITGIYRISPQLAILCMLNTTSLPTDLATTLVFWPPTAAGQFAPNDFVEACTRSGWPAAMVDQLKSHLANETHGETQQ